MRGDPSRKGTLKIHPYLMLTSHQMPSGTHPSDLECHPWMIAVPPFFSRAGGPFCSIQQCDDWAYFMSLDSRM